MIIISIRKALFMLLMQPLAQIALGQVDKPQKINTKKYTMLDKKLYEASINLTYLENPVVEKYCCRLLFKDTTSMSLAEAVSNINTYHPRNKSIQGTLKYVLELRNGREGYFQSYFMKYEEEDGKRMRGRERNFVYDIVHNKILTIGDILIPPKAKEVKQIAGKSYINILMSDDKIVWAYRQDGKMERTQLSFAETPECFKDSFKELLDWDAIMDKKAQQDIEKRKNDSIVRQATADGKMLKVKEKIVDEVPIAKRDVIVYEVVEQMPSFRGGTIYERVTDPKTKETTTVKVDLPPGDEGLQMYITNTMKYPVVAEENGFQGRVICTFVVDTDGSITDVKVIKSVESSLDKEAVRVLKGMPKWNPRRNKGEPVRVKYTVPVTFRLQ